MAAKTLAPLLVRFEALKLKEAKLEADLAIRECPDLQKPIAEVILAFVAAKEARDKCDLVAPRGPKKARLDAAREQVSIWQKKLDAETGTSEEALKRRTFYTAKLSLAQTAIAEIMDSKFEKLQAKYISAVESLHETYTRLLPLFEEHRFNWEYLLPSLIVFLRAEKPS